MTESLRRALFVAWLVASAALLPVAAAPWLVPERILEAVAARCRLEHPGGKPCALCGMTRAFASIGRWDWAEAARANPASPPLYVAILANEVTAAGLMFFRWRKPKGRIIGVDDSP